MLAEVLLKREPRSVADISAPQVIAPTIMVAAVILRQARASFVPVAISVLLGGGGGGATDFLSLTDTPDTYAGAAGKIVVVKDDESGLDFMTPPSATGSQLISGGGVVWTGTGFDFAVAAAIYTINGVQHSSPQTNVTLDPSDPTDDRIDVIAVDNTGAVVVIVGVPGGPPVEPQVDPATQLKLAFIYVPAASTTPPITNENIYLENTEWSTATNSGNINLASTSHPHTGAKDIEATNAVAGNLVTLTKPSGSLLLSDYTSLAFWIRSKASWPSPKSISIFWGRSDGGGTAGTAVALKTGTFGFDSSNNTTDQLIVIPVALFNTGATPIVNLRLQVAGGGGAIGWYIDDIILQSGGGGGGGGTGDFSTNTNVSVDGELVLFAGTTGKLGKRATGSGFVKLIAGVAAPVAIVRNFSFSLKRSAGLATGKIVGYWTCPFAGAITAWNLTVDAGTIAVKIWKKATGTARPTSADSINPTTALALTTGTSLHSTTLTAFSTLAVAVGDIFACEITSVGGGVADFGGSVEITT